MDITIIIWNPAFASVKLLAWFPFHPEGDCGRNSSAIHLINECYDYKFDNSIDLFPSKFPRNYFGCRIIVSTFVLEPFALSTTVSEDGVMNFTEGLEVKVFLTIMNKLNLTAQFLPQTGKSWGWVSPDGKWSGIFGDVQEGLADIAFAGLFIDIFNFPTFDGTIPYLKENLKFFVPLAGILPRWTNIFRMYNYGIWLGILISLVIGSFSMWIFANRIPFGYRQKGVHKDVSYFRIESCFRNSFLTLLGASVNTMPKTWILRVYFLPWIFYCMLINTGYQSMLISMFANPATEHQIKNLDEILASSLKTGFPQSLGQQLVGDSKTLLLAERSEHVEDFNKALARVAYDKNFAYVLAEYTVNFMSINSFRDSRYKLLLYPAEDVIVSFHMSMMTQKGSWLVTVLNKVISHILVSGLQKKWWQDLQISHRKVNNAIQSRTESDVVVPISLIHLQGAFLILAVGILVSLFTFLIEKSFTKRGIWISRNNIKIRLIARS